MASMLANSCLFTLQQTQHSDINMNLDINSEYLLSF